MAKRTNTARWAGTRWRIDVQKENTRKSFYSSAPGRTGQREANAKADAWLDEGLSPKGERVSKVYEQWMKDIKQTTSESNWRPIASRWKIWVLPEIGSRRVTALTEQNLQEIVNKAYAAGKSRKTLTSLCADLRAFCKYCRHCHLSSFLPEDLKVPTGARLKGKQILQPEDLACLMKSSVTRYWGKESKDEFINAYRFQVLTGLRPGELVGLQWEDISGNTINIRRAVNVRGEETKGKNDNAVRSFVMSALARQVLDAQREETGPSGSVFEIGSEHTYYKHWKIYCEHNGITPVSAYELRHTFVSVVKTLPAGEVKPLVGHSQDMDTFGIYSHELTGEGESTAQAVNGAFLKILKK